MSTRNNERKSGWFFIKLFCFILSIGVVCIFSYDGGGCGDSCPTVGETIYLYESRGDSVELCAQLDSLHYDQSNLYQWFDKKGKPVSPISSSECYTLFDLDTSSVGRYYCEITNKRLNTCCKREVIVQMFAVDSLGGKMFPDELVVLFGPNVRPTWKDSLRESINASLLEKCVCDSVQLWHLPLDADSVIIDGQRIDIEDKIGRLKNRSGGDILEVERNRPMIQESFNNYSQQRNKLLAYEFEENANSQQLNTSTISKRQVLVALIDSGIDYNHSKLVDKIWIDKAEANLLGVDVDGNCLIDDIKGRDFIDEDMDPIDNDNGHGTHVAGIIDSTFNFLVDIDDVELKILNIKCLDENGEGDLYDVVCGIFYAYNKEADIVNLSLGRYGEESPIMKTTIGLGLQKCKTLFVASAGNDSIDVINTIPHYPSGYDLENMLEIAALDSVVVFDGDIRVGSNTLASYSNFGTTVDIAVNGTWESTFLDDRDTTLQGTSMAAGYISGIAAAIISYHPDACKIDVIQHIKTSIARMGNSLSNGVQDGKYIENLQELKQRIDLENTPIDKNPCSQ